MLHGDLSRSPYYDLILESLGSGVIAFDKNSVIIVANPAACLHLELSPEVLREGANLDMAALPKPFADQIQEAIDSRKSASRREVTILRPDGTRKEIGLSVSLLHGPDAFNGAAVLFVDMTERRALERAAELNRQLAQVGELTAGVVHELRNPLTVISCHAELLERKLSPTDTGSRSVAAIRTEAKNLERLAGQFLTFSKPFDLELRIHRPEAVVARAFALCQIQADRKQVQLAYSQSAQARTELRCDFEKLSQALANIIGNAVDVLSPEGLIHVEITGNDNETIYLIDDTGPGIHLEPGQSLFSPFFSKKEGGTGLGLAIVHRIISAHGGKVSYTNRPEGGARFTIVIPASGTASAPSP